MLQRLQTVYLFLALVVTSLIFVFSFCSYESPESLASLSVDIFGVEFELTDNAAEIVAKQDNLSEEETAIRVEQIEKELNVHVDDLNKSKFGLIFTLGQVGVVVLMVLLVVMIFMYKNRRRQLRTGRLLFLLYLLVFVGVLLGASYGYNFLISQFGSVVDSVLKSELEEFEITYGIGTFLPAAAAAFIFLANLRIKSDEKLVRSLDRLR